MTLKRENLLLTKDDICLICERPSKLPPSSSADDYQMERYMNVANEAAARMAAHGDVCPSDDMDCHPERDCAECWHTWLEAQCSG